MDEIFLGLLNLLRDLLKIEKFDVCVLFFPLGETMACNLLF